MALLLVVLEASKVYLPAVLEGLVVLLLVVLMVLLVLEALVVLLLEAPVILTVPIPEISPLRVGLPTVLHHNNLSINLLMVLLVLYAISILPVCAT